MNAKKVKVIRREVTNWREAEYNITRIGNGNIGISLKPSCGRAAYKYAKERAA